MIPHIAEIYYEKVFANLSQKKYLNNYPAKIASDRAEDDQVCFHRQHLSDHVNS